MTMIAPIKVALLQMTACGADQQSNLEKGDAYCRQAKALGADIALFPEMWNIGYTPFHQDILLHDYTREDAVFYADDIKKWQAQAISTDSAFVQHFRALAKELKMAIAITYLEKIRDFRKRDVWGNAYRKPKQYQLLTALEILEPFKRDNAKR